LIGIDLLHSDVRCKTATAFFACFLRSFTQEALACARQKTFTSQLLSKHSLFKRARQNTGSQSRDATTGNSALTRHAQGHILLDLIGIFPALHTRHEVRVLRPHFIRRLHRTNIGVSADISALLHCTKAHPASFSRTLHSLLSSSGTEIQSCARFGGSGYLGCAYRSLLSKLTTKYFLSAR
jgi:hypothetical protein